MSHLRKITTVRPKALKEFKALYKKCFNKEITDEFAQEDVLRLLNLLHTLLELQLNVTPLQKEKEQEVDEIIQRMNTLLTTCFNLEREGGYKEARELFTLMIVPQYPLDMKKQSSTRIILKHYHEDPLKREKLNLEDLFNNLIYLKRETREILRKRMIPESEIIPRDATLMEIYMNSYGYFTEEEKWNYNQRK